MNKKKTTGELSKSNFTRVSMVRAKLLRTKKWMEIQVDTRGHIY